MKQPTMLRDLLLLPPIPAAKVFSPTEDQIFKNVQVSCRLRDQTKPSGSWQHLITYYLILSSLLLTGLEGVLGGQGGLLMLSLSSP